MSLNNEVQESVSKINNELDTLRSEVHRIIGEYIEVSETNDLTFIRMIKEKYEELLQIMQVIINQMNAEQDQTLNEGQNLSKLKSSEERIKVTV